MSRRNTDNGQGRSEQGNDPDGSSAPSKVAEMDAEVAKALRNVAKTLPAGYSVDETKLSQRAKEYQNARGTNKARSKLYPLLGDLYDKLMVLNAHPKKQEQFVHIVHGIQREKAIEWGTDLSAILVQFYLKRSLEKARDYADALCEAALEGILPGDLARFLGENGNSVKLLATRFAARSKESGQTTPKRCKIELLCSEKQWKRLQEDDLTASQRLIVERRDKGQFELVKAMDFKPKSKGNGQEQFTTGGPEKPRPKGNGQAETIRTTKGKRRTEATAQYRDR